MRAWSVICELEEKKTFQRAAGENFEEIETKNVKSNAFGQLMNGFSRKITSHSQETCEPEICEPEPLPQNICEPARQTRI